MISRLIIALFWLVSVVTSLAICASIIALAGDLIGIWDVVDWI